MELVDGDQSVVEGLDAELLDGETEGGVGADQHLVVAVEEGADGIDLAAVGAGRVAQVPAGGDVQSAQKPNVESGSSLKLAPIDRSGTTMIAWRRPWL